MEKEFLLNLYRDAMIALAAQRELNEYDTIMTQVRSRKIEILLKKIKELEEVI
jgi:hypothetical protein